jgi:hypothetical protein
MFLFCSFTYKCSMLHIFTSTRPWRTRTICDDVTICQETKIGKDCMQTLSNENFHICWKFAFPNLIPTGFRPDEPLPSNLVRLFPNWCSHSKLYAERTENIPFLSNLHVTKSSIPFSLRGIDMMLFTSTGQKFSLINSSSQLPYRPNNSYHDLF